MVSLLNERQILEKILSSNGGDLTDPELDLIWSENSASIQEKIDAYGFVVQSLRNELEKLNELENDLKEKIKNKQQTIEKNTMRILERLHFIIGEEPVRGYLFKIKPTFKKERKIDSEKLEDHFLYQTVEIRLDCWKKILNNIEETLPGPDICFRCVGGPKYKVSELPEGHNAIETILIPTCQIS